MSKKVPAAAVMVFLSQLYCIMDALVDRHGIFKVETAGGERGRQIPGLEGTVRLEAGGTSLHGARLYRCRARHRLACQGQLVAAPVRRIA